MAFTGVHVVCARVGDNYLSTGAKILGRIEWSEAPSSATPTSKAAPETAQLHQSQNDGRCVFHIRAAADSYVAIGPNPVASAHPRLLIPANTDVDIYVSSGDKLAWIVVP